jgi:2,6-dihydroxypyridine 3-monooxygenase
MRAVVIGGSVGGLTAALVLRDLGWDVRVFERSASTLTSRGAGIVVQPATVRYFLENDVVELDRVSTSVRCLRYLERGGKLAREEPWSYRFTSWNTLYRTLLGCMEADRYHLGEALVGFDQDASEVCVRLSSGRQHLCDLLVCADGASSTARGLLLPDIRPTYAGYVGWRGTVAEGDLSGGCLPDAWEAILYHLMSSSHILAYPIPAVDGSVEVGKRLINFVWYRNVAEGSELDDLMTDRDGVRRDTSLPPGAVRRRFVRDLRKDAQDLLPPALAEVVVSTPEPFVQPIVDVEVPRMAFERACLLGDAAFVARPHAAAGTAKAAADAWALAEAMAGGGGDVPAALARWESGQLALGSRLVARVKDLGRRSQFDGGWHPGDPSLRFGLWGPGE